MKKKAKGFSIKTIILIPVFVLGIVYILSTIQAITNIRKVNSNVSVIADEYMTSISKLSEIQNEIQNVHRNALYHIIETDLDNMINIAATIHEDEALLEQSLKDYEANYLIEGDRAGFERIVANYEEMKHGISSMVTFSANNQKAEAYILVNKMTDNYIAAIQQEISILIINANIRATDARIQSAMVYQSSLLSNGFTILLSVVVLAGASVCVLFFLIRPISATSKQIRSIIADIDRNEGDLTKRVKIVGIKEIAELGSDFNMFMDKVQENVDSVRNEVDDIAEKSNKINDYTKEMKVNADKMENTRK